MEDNRFREKINYTTDQELNFTKEDRNKVFEQIHKSQTENYRKKKSFSSPNKSIPFTVSLLVAGLCLFLFLPSMLQGGVNQNTNSSDLNTEPNRTVPSTTGIEDAKVLTTLITVKSKEMDNRIYLNLLLSYSRDKKKMKVVSLPYDTYAPIGENLDGTSINDKLLFAYNFGGAENVRTTVSKLFDLPIDNFAVIDLDTFSTLIETMNGIEYDLQDDITVRGITQVALEFKKGVNHLNGEEVVALMLAATEPNKLDEGTLLTLIDAVMDKTENEISSIQTKEPFAQIETNISIDQLLDNQIEFKSVTSLSLSGGMIDDAITISKSEGKHIYRFEKDFLNAVSQQLTTFK